MKTTNILPIRQVVIFFIATYTASWILFFIGKKLDLMLIMMLGIWAPSIVSVILTGLFYGKRGLKDFFSRFKRYKVSWYWWVVLLLLPAAIHFLGRSLWQVVYDGELNPFFRKPQYWLSAIIPSFLIAGLGEELGWRGFALPRLQLRFTAIQSAFILGTVHLLWHLPTYWLGQGMHNVPFLFILCFVFPWTILFNWLYNKSGGSLIFAVSFHAISNSSLSIVRFMPLDSEVPIVPELLTQTSLPIDLAGPYLTVCFIYLLAAIAVIKFGKFNQVNTDLP